MISSTCQIHSNRKESGGCQGLGRGGEGELMFNGDRVSIWDDEHLEIRLRLYT